MTDKEYFYHTVNKVKQALNFNECDIISMNHSQLTGKNKKAIGICHRFNSNQFLITIDEFFITECHDYFINENKNSTWFLVGETLEQVICHEIAHITEWRHGVKHKTLMNQLLEQIKECN